MMNQTEIVSKFDEISKLLNVTTKIDGFKEHKENHLEGLKDILGKVDTDIRDSQINKCFTPKGNLTKYGEYLVLTRYCLGWLFGYYNSEEQRITFLKADDDYHDKIRSSCFAYLVYYHLGDDFLVSNIIGKVMAELQYTKLVKDRTKIDVEEESLHFYMNKIYDGIYTLLNTHYGPKHRPRLYNNFPKDKIEPDLAILDAMEKIANQSRLFL